MKYLIYARISERGSTFDGETSISMQINFCREYVKFHGGTVADVRSDEFFSGKDTNRPAFREILEELDRGDGDWDTLIVYKLSRMTRSLHDGAEIFEKLFRQGRGFVSATENLDFSSPAGRAMLGMMQVFNQFEREQTAENTRNKMLSIAAKGEWPAGNPPFGYRRGERKDNKLYVDERKAEIVRDVFKMYASGQPSGNIVQKYRDAISKTTLFTMLRNKIYLGKMVYAGKEFPGKHPAIVPRALFDRVQRIMPAEHTYNRPRAQKYPYLLSGLIFCKCGRRMAPQSAKSGQYHYYACPDCRIRMDAEKVEAKALEYLREIDIDKETIQEAINIITERQEAERRSRRPEIDQVTAAIRNCEDEKKRLLELVIDGHRNMSEDMIKALNEKFEAVSAELNRLAARKELLQQELPQEQDYFARAMEILSSLRKISKQLTDTSDPIALRQVILASIERIKLTDSDEFQIYGSSSICKKWHAMPDLFELLLLRFSVSKIIRNSCRGGLYR